MCSCYPRVYGSYIILVAVLRALGTRRSSGAATGAKAEEERFNVVKTTIIGAKEEDKGSQCQEAFEFSLALQISRIISEKMTSTICGGVWDELSTLYHSRPLDYYSEKIQRNLLSSPQLINLYYKITLLYTTKGCLAVTTTHSR